MTEAIYQKSAASGCSLFFQDYSWHLGDAQHSGHQSLLDLSFSVFGVQIPMMVAIGVLPYPVTFMCTDLISELYGEEKARDMVWVGLLLNLWVVFLLWLGSVLPGTGTDPATGAPLVDAAGREPVFFEIKNLAFGGRRVDDCLSGRAVLRCTHLPYDEAADQGAALMVTQQCVHHDQPNRGFNRSHFSYPLLGGGITDQCGRTVVAAIDGLYRFGLCL